MTQPRIASVTCAGVADREGDLGDDDAGAGALRGVHGRIARRVVFMVVDEDLVTWLEVQRPQDGARRNSGVRHERQVVWIGADERSDHRPRLADLSLELASEEVDRVGFEAILPLSLGRQDRRRTGTERAVIEERHRRIEGPGGGAAGSAREREPVDPVVTRPRRPGLGGRSRADGQRGGIDSRLGTGP